MYASYFLCKIESDFHLTEKKMKRILLLLLPFTLFAQMEFEEVFKIFPVGGIARYSKVYIKNDTILIKSDVSTPEIIEFEAYFLSTNSGKTFEDISDRVRSSLPLLGGDTEPGVFHPTGFFFVKRNFTDIDTSIYYISLDGEIMKKVEYPYRGGFLFSSYIELNHKDPNYLALHHNFFMFVNNTYYHQLSMSPDRGESWKSLAPEGIIKEEKGIALTPNREITTVYSERNNGNIFAKFYYESTFSSFTQYLVYNYITDKYNLINTNFEMEKVFNFESFHDNSLDLVSESGDGYYYQDLESSEKFLQLDFYDLLNLNKDSINSENENLQIGEFSNGQGYSFFKTNPNNINHKILSILLTSSFGQVSDLVNHQFFFQTFDNGKTWEFIFENIGMEEQVFDFFIKANDMSLWIIKDSELDYRRNASSSHPILYKSKSPLTSVENQSESKFNVDYSNGNLNIISETYFNNSTISIYNLNGKTLLNKSIDLQMGENSITIEQPIDDKLILVQITTNETQIFKLISSD